MNLNDMMQGNFRCDRCGKTNACLSMSWFNTDMICIACSEKEKEREDYKEAKEKENAEVKKGNYNYEGKGL